MSSKLPPNVQMDIKTWNGFGRGRCICHSHQQAQEVQAILETWPQVSDIRITEPVIELREGRPMFHTVVLLFAYRVRRATSDGVGE